MGWINALRAASNRHLLPETPRPSLTPQHIKPPSPLPYQQLPLPPGWEMKLDQRTGVPFFIGNSYKYLSFSVI